MNFLSESWRLIVGRSLLYMVLLGAAYTVAYATRYPFGLLVEDRLDRLWARFLDRFDDGEQFLLPVVGGWLVMFITYWAFGLAMLLVDITRRPAWLWQRKYQKTRQYAYAGSEYNPPLVRTVALVLFNQLFVFLPGLWLMQRFFTHTALLPWRTGIRVERELPTLASMLITFSWAVFLEEFLFYYSHWLMHTRLLYRTVHKVHHSYKAPHTIASLYAHPFEALTANLVAMNLPLFVCNFHLLTFYVAICLGWMSSLVGHCGYDLPLLSLFIPKHDFHDLHHERFAGNYGTAGWLDALLGTDIKENKQHIEV